MWFIINYRISNTSMSIKSRTIFLGKNYNDFEIRLHKLSEKETRTYLQESCEINLMKSLKRTMRLVPMYSLHQQVFITSQNADSGTKNEDD